MVLLEGETWLRVVIEAAVYAVFVAVIADLDQH
jgi:hypothetical protein